jgi:hypothetical protein
MLLLSCSFAWSQSQPPPPTPPEAAQVDENQAAPEQDETSTDDEPAELGTVAVDEPTSVVASREEQQPGDSDQDESSADWWSFWSTISVTIFTGALAFLAYLQWRSMREQAGCMREAFISTHRPKLAVRWMDCDEESLSRGREITGTFELFNMGDTKAVVQKCYSDLIVAESLPAAAPYRGLQGKQITVELIPGGSTTISFPTQTTNLPFKKFEAVRNRQQTAKRGIADIPSALFVVGWIEYSDESRHVRKMGFCRKYDFSTKTFIREPHPDYEYGDQG